MESDITAFRMTGFFPKLISAKLVTTVVPCQILRDPDVTVPTRLRISKWNSSRHCSLHECVYALSQRGEVGVTLFSLFCGKTPSSPGLCLKMEGVIALSCRGRLGCLVPLWLLIASSPSLLRRRTNISFYTQPDLRYRRDGSSYHRPDRQDSCLAKWCGDQMHSRAERTQEEILQCALGSLYYNRTAGHG